MAAAGREVAPLWESRGLEPPPYGGAYDHLYLDIYPPEMQPEAAPHVPDRHLLRPVSDDGPLETSSPLPLPDGPQDAPLVYLTMGTVFNNPQLFHMIVPTLSDLNIRLLVTVGPHSDPAVLGAQPAHVRVERYVPQSMVLPHCSAVVSHAGSGTVLATVTNLLPQLCLPQGADQFLNAAAVVSAGVGLSLTPGQLNPDAIRDAIARLFADPSFRDAANKVSASIASMPAPDEVAALLETLPGG
jgi:MGT family glycosyltransferase